MAGASRLVATITNNNGRLSSAGPITLKNQIQEIRSIENITDVSVVEAANGATLIYNSQNDKYEVRQLQVADLNLNLDLDGGSF
jgi:hypothetical protein